MKLLVLHHSLLLSADSVLVDTEELERIQSAYKAIFEDESEEGFMYLNYIYL